MIAAKVHLCEAYKSCKCIRLDGFYNVIHQWDFFNAWSECKSIVLNGVDLSTDDANPGYTCEIRYYSIVMHIFTQYAGPLTDVYVLQTVSIHGNIRYDTTCSPSTGSYLCHEVSWRLLHLYVKLTSFSHEYHEIFIKSDVGIALAQMELDSSWLRWYS